MDVIIYTYRLLQDPERTIQIGLGEPDKLILYYTEQITRNPKSCVYFNNRGVGYARKGAYDLAIQDLETALMLYEVKGNASHTYYNLGNVYLYKQDIPKAIECYTESIECFPSGPAFLNRAVAYFLSGDRGRAIDDYREAANWDVEEAAEALHSLDERDS